MIDKQRGYIPSNTMRELIRDNNLLLPVISRFNIAFGFGDAPVEQICMENGVDTKTFLTVCNMLSGYYYDADNISLPSLMGYLKRAHSSFLDVALPRIRHHLIEAINSSDANEVSLLLIKFFDNYVGEVKRHLEHENNIIFRYVEELLEGHTDPNFNITKFSVDHEPMAAKLNELKDIFIYHHKQKENARLSSTLFDIIVCERDLMSHFDVENNLFVPAVENLEHRLQEANRAEMDNHEDRVSGTPENSVPLSERERDIIRCVALGMSNKEIADRLCISSHTVATHRRNISGKLDIHSSAGLTIFAIINGIISIDDVS